MRTITRHQAAQAHKNTRQHKHTNFGWWLSLRPHPTCRRLLAMTRADRKQLQAMWHSNALEVSNHHAKLRSYHFTSSCLYLAAHPQKKPRWKTLVLSLSACKSCCCSLPYAYNPSYSQRALHQCNSCTASTHAQQQDQYRLSLELLQRVHAAKCGRSKMACTCWNNTSVVTAKAIGLLAKKQAHSQNTIRHTCRQSRASKQ
jgi:hypothetical protein